MSRADKIRAIVDELLELAPVAEELGTWQIDVGLGIDTEIVEVIAAAGGVRHTSVYAPTDPAFGWTAIDGADVSRAIDGATRKHYVNVRAQSEARPATQAEIEREIAGKNGGDA